MAPARSSAGARASELNGDMKTLGLAMLRGARLRDEDNGEDADADALADAEADEDLAAEQARERETNNPTRLLVRPPRVLAACDRVACSACRAIKRRWGRCLRH